MICFLSSLLRYGLSVISSKSLRYIDSFFTFTNFYPLFPWHPTTSESLFMSLVSKMLLYTRFIEFCPMHLIFAIGKYLEERWHAGFWNHFPLILSAVEFCSSSSICLSPQPHGTNSSFYEHGCIC